MTVLVAASCSGGSDRAAVVPTVPTAADGLEVTSLPVPTVAPREPAAFDAESELESLLANQLTVRGGASAGGMIGYLWVGDEIVAGAVGDADSAGRQLESDTPMRVGSVSKTIVATMVLQLMDEGVVDLDAELGTYLPATVLGADRTIRELLQHTSGLANYTAGPRFWTRVLESGQPGGSGAMSPTESLEWASAMAETTRGVHAYANTNYVLLGQLIEELDGRSLNDSLDARIKSPLGLQVTVFGLADRPDPPGLAAPWSNTGLFSGEPDANYQPVHSGWADGSLISTADELALIFRAVFDGTLVSSAALVEMADVNLELLGMGPPPYALGLLVQMAGGDVWWGHNGLNAGFKAEVNLEPVSGDVLVVLTNTDWHTPVPIGRLADLRKAIIDGGS